MKYLLIENLMGGCAWILKEYLDELELHEVYKFMNSGTFSSGDIQKYIVTEEDFNREIESGTLQYL